MADPQAETKERNSLATAVALGTVYHQARSDVVRRILISLSLRPIWRQRVQDVLTAGAKSTARAVGRNMIGDRFEPERLDHYLEKVAETRAATWESNINEVLSQIDQAAEDAIAEIGNPFSQDAADSDANELVDLAGNFAGLEAAKQDGLATKTWHDPGTNNRPTHEAMDGLTIPLYEDFPIGLPYPHAPGPPSETVNCDCYLTFGR